MSTNTSPTMGYLESIAGRPLTLGAAISAIRVSENLSLKAFSATLGVSVQYLCDLEHDRKRVSSKQAAKFARVLEQSEMTFVELCLQDHLRENDLEFKVTLSEVA